MTTTDELLDRIVSLEARVAALEARPQAVMVAGPLGTLVTAGPMVPTIDVPVVDGNTVTSVQTDGK